MYIYNGFSHIPTRNFTAAGIDFYIPDVKDDETEKVKVLSEALKHSFKITDKEIEYVMNTIDLYANEIIYEKLKNNYWNVIHLFYALKDKTRYEMTVNSLYTQDDVITYFINNVLTFDANGRPGVKCKFSDMLFINSGIKIALSPETCLEFKNKSGKGTQGWSVKACLVDEDYSGYMHLSLQYLWWDESFGTIYVGDKITQGVVYKTLTDDAIELSNEEYNEKMKNSNRGNNGFGSSDIKH